MPTLRRLPISSRHAFALAFDLAFRRDFLHSLAVPLLLQTPWVILLPLLPPLQGNSIRLVLSVWMLASVPIGLWFTGLLISAMLRFRARSVFNTQPGSQPASARSCYAQALKRMPVLYCTEVIRAALSALGGFMLFFPGLYLGFKFSMATETVVLTDERPRWRTEMRALFLVLAIPIVVIPLLTLVPYLMVPSRLWIVTATVAGLELATLVLGRRVLFGGLLGTGVVPALRRSFLLTEGRWERWLEMIAISVMLIVPIWFLMAVCWALAGSSTLNAWFALGAWLTQAALVPVQYAWTFFYLRLEESEAVTVASNTVVTTGPMGGPGDRMRRPGTAPKLRLVELARDDDDEGPPDS